MREQVYHADVVSGEQHVRLVVANAVDGWLAAVYYPDTKESINLSEAPEVEEAKAVVEDWVRVVHNVRGSVEWIPGWTSN